MNSNIFKNKRVLVTGHTGFKGSWLSAWLSKLGAKVICLSDRVPTEPAHYDLIKENLESDLRMNVNDAETMYSIINDIQPDFVFHLAAQPIVLESYSNPLKTFNTNIMGTGNLLECLRNTKSVKSVVIITTDKVYRIKKKK